MADIVVVGSFVTDMVATMSRFPDAGETIIGNHLNVFLGGKGANQCIAIKRLGGNVQMAGMLGNDENGKSFLKLFADEGINTDYIFMTNEQPTSVAQVQIDDNSQNRICVIPGANFCFNSEHLKTVENTIRTAKLIVAQLELTTEITRQLIIMCKKHNVPIMLNPAPAAKLPAELISLVEYITPNETELAILSGMPTNTDMQVEQACAHLAEMGVKCVIATLGSRGAYIYDNGGGRLVNGFKVKAVDTVAAGDSFNGAMAVALIEGKSIDEAVLFANAMGALTVQVKGAIQSLHYRKDVEAFIINH